MSETTISRFAVPELADLADDVRARILAVQEKAGFVPNVFLMLAHRPAEFRAFFDYHDTLMEKDVGLSKAEREMIVVATSGANNCLYCVVAHGAVLRIRAKNPRVADQLATNYRKAEITARQRAMLDFAMKLSLDGGRVEDADMAALREHGFDDEAIWDIGAITAFFSMSNRLVHLTGTPPNEQFYLMGRLPKG
ncbi:MAG: peroxidase-related enzyme [Zoogloeaceae bacterium]|nr:peroxidase-related enzyme [Zoogloeaceae bacterium]MCP5253571.1 peroxidase-related enzyme [Zoogloeaceae bacterium]MCP5294895.1 peroxidase-related enzyme [Zoogloeaceae bacterium]MCW5616980.1 peroxidase-related enzyme [Rhodocyclaceae bacterium]